MQSMKDAPNSLRSTFRDFDELEDELLAAALNRINNRIETIEGIKLEAAQSKVSSHETTDRKKAFFLQKHGLEDDAGSTFDDATLEAQIGNTDEIVSIEFLEEGILAGRPVGRVSVLSDAAVGSGFLVGEGLFLTNHHVLRSPEMAMASTVRFNFEDNKYGKVQPISEFLLKPKDFWLTDKNLDYTLVALSTLDDTGGRVDTFGWHPLLKAGKILQGMPVNIIQHPGGNRKSIALHNSNFLLVEDGSEVDPFCWYTGDTKKGSSGAPVFSNDWKIVALHHKAVPRVDEHGNVIDRLGNPMSAEDFHAFPEKAEYIANEGIRASRLLKAIQEATLSSPAHNTKREQLLGLWSSDAARFLRRRIPMNS
jgi:endonuclease G, mitochondrial